MLRRIKGGNDGIVRLCIQYVPTVVAVEGEVIGKVEIGTYTEALSRYGLL